jgi:hypothetical protein
LQAPDQAFTTDLTKFQEPEGTRKIMIPENRVKRFLYEQFEAGGFRVLKIEESSNRLLLQNPNLKVLGFRVLMKELEEEGND